MNKKEFIEEMNKALSKIDLVYYDKNKIKFIPCPNEKGHSYFYISFCLPYLSLKNLLRFCLSNNFLLAYDSDSRKIEINVGNIYNIDKIKIYKKSIKFKWGNKIGKNRNIED